jgi:hypothetical protein
MKGKPRGDCNGDMDIESSRSTNQLKQSLAFKYYDPREFKKVAEIHLTCLQHLGVEFVGVKLKLWNSIMGELRNMCAIELKS